MQSSHSSCPQVRPAALDEDWDDVEPGWWYAIARDDTEVHIQAEAELGWSVTLMRCGDTLGLPSYEADLDVIVAQALDLLATHNVRLAA